MTYITEHPTIPGAAFLDIEANKLALYAATHDLITPEVINLLQVGQMADLTLSLHETGVYLGIHDPTVARHPRLIFATGVFHVVMVAQGQVWSSSEKVDDLRPIRGLVVPGGVAVGMQAMQNNRSTYIVLGHRNDVPNDDIPFDDPLVSNHWQTMQGERTLSVVTGNRLS